jgi:ABC-2 type transport system ATP-binding protein
VFGVRLGDRSTYARIGLMPQHGALYSELTVRENLAFRAAVHGIADRGNGALTACGLETVADVRVAALSGGWSRRADFAATILHAPHLVLLDEPTAGLDVATRARMWDWIEGLAANDRAVIVSTHDLIEAERCDTVLLYQGGIASAQATPAALKAEHGKATLEDIVRATATD